MHFSVGADAYERFIGPYSAALAPRFAAFAGISSPARVLDVGCGPGALTQELARLLGSGSVCAVDPEESFVDAARARNEAVPVQQAHAEDLPFPDGTFDAALAQLVVHFMDDPVAGLREMARVTRPGGTVAACVWDHAGGRSPLSVFWDAAHATDENVRDESGLAGARAGHLRELFQAADLLDVEESEISVEVEHAGFEQWWDRFLLGVGPAGAYARQLSPERQLRLRDACRERLQDERPKVSAVVWAARARVA